MQFQRGQVAIVCPGHGGEHDQMRLAVARRRPDLLALAQQLVKDDPFERIQEGTVYVQPAVYCASIAAWDTVKDDLEPVAVAGHSLGELAAAAIAGAISIEDGLRLAVIRGRACQQAAEDHPGGMVILKVDAARALELAAPYNLEIANENAPLQTVVAGAARSIDKLHRDVRRLRIPALRLRTAVPFHTAAMHTAGETIAEALGSIDISTPRYELLSVATGLPSIDLRSELASALTRPVRWHATTLALHALGVGRYLETGPGRLLCGLIRQILHDEAIIAASLDDSRRHRA